MGERERGGRERREKHRKWEKRENTEFLGEKKKRVARKSRREAELKRWKFFTDDEKNVGENVNEAKFLFTARAHTHTARWRRDERTFSESREWAEPSQVEEQLSTENSFFLSNSLSLRTPQHAHLLCWAPQRVKKKQLGKLLKTSISSSKKKSFLFCCRSAALFALIRRELVEWNVNEHVKFGIQKFSTLSPPTQCDSWGFASFFSLSHFLNFSPFSPVFLSLYILTFSSCCWRGGEWGVKLGHKPHLRWESFQCTSTRWIFFWWFTHSANGLCSTNTPTKTSTELVLMEFEWSWKISTSQLAKTFLSYIFPPEFNEENDFSPFT